MRPGRRADKNTTPPPRGGAAALVTLVVTQFMTDSVEFIVTVQHKNRKDPTFVDAGVFAGISGNGTYSKDISNIKQIVRLAMKFDSGTIQGDQLCAEAVQYIWRMYP